MRNNRANKNKKRLAILLQIVYNASNNKVIKFKLNKLAKSYGKVTLAKN